MDYFTDVEFRSVESDPSTAKTFEYRGKADTGEFNENFNQGFNKYSITNLNIEVVGGDAIEEVSSVKNTLVTLTVNSTENSFINPIATIAHKTLQPETTYKGSNVAYRGLFDYDIVRLEGLVGSSSLIIKNAQISNILPNSYDVSFEIEINKAIKIHSI